MGILKVGAQVMKPIICLIKLFARSIIYHPFLVGILFFLFFLNKSFPFLFSLFVYASPVLVSTVILLGTLLSFGQNNLPENEIENSSFVSLKTGGRYGVKRYNNDKEVMEKGDRNSPDFEPLIHEKSSEVKSQKPDLEVETKRESSWVVLEDYCSANGNNNKKVESKTDRPMVEHVDPCFGEKVESSQETNVRDESTDAESDGDKTVSRDPSMVGVIPLIDELDPLLDENAPHPVPNSQETSNYGTDESDDDDTSEEEEYDDADNDDEDEEGDKSGNEGENTSAIPWTEDDQKNVANLGTIELERNERLEGVIARRRWQRLMAEKSLIDLDITDFPTNNVAPISTTRQNPFDLPSIPGSAPSRIQPQSNPFDLPFHRNEEPSEPLVDISHQGLSAFPPKEMSFRRHESFNVVPAFSGESLMEDLSTFPPKEASLRRHESFNVGPSIVGSKLKPFFVPERMGFEGTSYTSLERQLSDINESGSSGPDTESVSSDEDKDGDKVSDGDFSHEPELISDLDHVSQHVEHGSESSEDEDALELGQAEENAVDHDEVEIKFGDVESNAGVASTVSETGDEVDSKRSSSSSLSGILVEIPDEDEYEVASVISVANSSSELPKEPVYDSSPRGIHKNLSFSSISSEVQVVLSETDDPTLLVKKTESLADRECNLSDENIDIDASVNGEKESKHKPSSENKSAVTDSVDEVVVLPINPDQIQMSSSDEKLQVSTEQEKHKELSPMSSPVITKEAPARTLGEQLPSSDESMAKVSLEAHEDLQVIKEEPSIVKTEAVVETTISHDHKQESVEEIENSRNVETKISSDLNVGIESNSTSNLANVSSISVSDHRQESGEMIEKSKSDGETKSRSDLNVAIESNSTSNLANVSCISVSDHKQESTKEIEESKKDGETKSSLDLNGGIESNSVENTFDVSSESVSDNGKDKEKEVSMNSSSSSSSSSSDSE